MNTSSAEAIDSVSAFGKLHGMTGLEEVIQLIGKPHSFTLGRVEQAG